MEIAIALSVGLVLIEIVGVCFAVDAIMTGRTAQGTIAWAAALVLVPFIAVPLYLLFGSRRFRGYIRVRRFRKNKVRSLFDPSHDAAGNALTERPQEFVDAATRLNKLITDFGGATLTSGDLPRIRKLFDVLGILPMTRGNRVELLIDGDATFAAIERAIDAARDYVLIQFYIVEDDGLGKRMLEAVRRARSRGVRVYFMYDQLGSASLPDSYDDALADCGVQIGVFRAGHVFLGLRNPWQLNFRNHRKIVVTDGRMAFVGGHNVGDAYLGLHNPPGYWRDTHIELEGPAVIATQLAFIEDWNWATSETLDLTWSGKPEWLEEHTRSPHTDQRVVVVPSGPADELDTFQLLVTTLMHSAKRRLWIASPYFVPDEATLAALQSAALRGVDVRVIVPERADSTLVWLAGMSYWDDVLPSGAKLFRYQRGFLHQKVILSDDVATVGTANLDNRSLRINFELTCVVDDQPFAEQVAAMLEADLAHCKPVAIDAFAKMRWSRRFAARCARLLAPIL